MSTPEKKPFPKRACIINIMFGVKEDEEALEVKAKIDETLKHIEEKRYSFQITEG